MDKRQQQLILDLAKKLKQDKKSKTQSFSVLESAGIIASKGQNNNNYPNLNRVLKTA